MSFLFTYTVAHHMCNYSRLVTCLLSTVYGVMELLYYSLETSQHWILITVDFSQYMVGGVIYYPLKTSITEITCSTKQRDRMNNLIPYNIALGDLGVDAKRAMGTDNENLNFSTRKSQKKNFNTKLNKYTHKSGHFFFHRFQNIYQNNLFRKKKFRKLVAFSEKNSNLFFGKNFLGKISSNFFFFYFCLKEHKITIPKHIYFLLYRNSEGRYIFFKFNGNYKNSKI